MNSKQAQTAVGISAFWVAMIFAYRKLTEAGKSTVPSTAHFVIGFGFTFVVLSTMATAAPALGGMFAVLVATGDTMANGLPLLNDLQTGLKTTKAATSPAAAVTVASTSPNAQLPGGTYSTGGG